MPESAPRTELSRRRLLLSGLAIVPAGAVLAASRPGTAPAAVTQPPRPAWPGPDSAAGTGRVYFC